MVTESKRPRFESFNKRAFPNGLPRARPAARVHKASFTPDPDRARSSPSRRAGTGCCYLCSGRSPRIVPRRTPSIIRVLEQMTPHPAKTFCRSCPRGSGPHCFAFYVVLANTETSEGPVSHLSVCRCKQTTS